MPQPPPPSVPPPAETKVPLARLHACITVAAVVPLPM
jgi:hypothetical protein